MTSSHLQQWIQHPETLNRDTLYELRTLVARYPYFQSLRLLYLKNLYLLHDINFGAELRKAVLYVADRRILFYLIEGDHYILKCQQPTPLSLREMDEEPSIDRTLSLIDAFLATAPKDTPQTMEMDYTMDYTSYLLQEEGANALETQMGITPKLRGHELIDGFIMKSEATNVPLFGVRTLPDVDAEVAVEIIVEDAGEKEVHVELAEPEAAGIELVRDGEETPASSNEELDDSCFTETLAKIYIKQRRYDKALEIIKKLSLNYPKKNAYFADQIRFLEKLIINAKSK